MEPRTIRMCLPGFKPLKTHTHAADVVSDFDTDGELARHMHDAEAMPPKAPADAHTHANVNAHSGDPIHSHTADYEAVAGVGDDAQHIRPRNGQWPNLP